MELWERASKMEKWQLCNPCASAHEGSRSTQLRKPAAYLPTACPVNAKTKHTCLLPAVGGWRAKMSILEDWQMPWHCASPFWAPTLPLSVAHPDTPVLWLRQAEDHPQPKLAQCVELSQDLHSRLAFSPPKGTPPTPKPACLPSPTSEM